MWGGGLGLLGLAEHAARFRVVSVALTLALLLILTSDDLVDWAGVSHSRTAASVTWVRRPPSTAWVQESAARAPHSILVLSDEGHVVAGQRLSATVRSVAPLSRTPLDCSTHGLSLAAGTAAALRLGGACVPILAAPFEVTGAAGVASFRALRFASGPPGLWQLRFEAEDASQTISAPLQTSVEVLSSVAHLAIPDEGVLPVTVMMRRLLNGSLAGVTAPSLVVLSRTGAPLPGRTVVAFAR